MRFLRFVALILVVALAYSTQFVLHPPLLSPLSSFFPSHFYTWIPDLSRLRALLAGDIRDAAFFLLAVAAVTFGHLTAPWSLTDAPRSSKLTTLVLPGVRRRQRLGWFFVSGALLVAIVAGILFRVQLPTHADAFITKVTVAISSVPLLYPLVSLVHTTPWLTPALWATSLFLLFLGSGLFPWRASEEAAEHSSATGTPNRQPMSSWPLLILLLPLASILYSWRLMSIPLALDIQVAEVGLSALSWLRKGETLFLLSAHELEPGLHLAGLATAVPALLLRFTNDLLLSIRLTGISSALLTLIATWLLGTELFRRIPTRLSTEAGEDQGQWPTLVATLLVTLMIAMLLFTRVPIVLETAAWGTLGCWALLRGLRTGDRLAVGLSGVLIGLSALLYTPGIAFVLTACCWWAAYWFLQSGWLPHRSQPQVSGSRLRGDFLLWIIGLAPTLGVRWFILGEWLPPLQGTLRSNWQPTLLAFGQQGDLSQLGGLGVPLLHDLLAPILVLAVGALCFNLDRRVGWMLLTWLGSGLLWTMVLAPTAPVWPALAPLLPATGLVLAFGLDRFRITIMQSAGLWTRNLLNYLVLGLIFWVGLSNIVEYYHAAQQQTDTVSALGYELRTISGAESIIIVAPSTVSHNAPQLRFLTNEWQTPPRAVVTFAETMPESAPAGAVILLTPADAALLPTLQARYPEGSVLVRRDHLANPLLYRYTIP